MPSRENKHFLIFVLSPEFPAHPPRWRLFPGMACATKRGLVHQLRNDDTMQVGILGGGLKVISKSGFFILDSIGGTCSPEEEGNTTSPEREGPYESRRPCGSPVADREDGSKSEGPLRS